MSKCIQTQRWLGGSLTAMLVAGCGLVPGAATGGTEQAGRTLQGVGVMVDELSASPGRATLASNRADTPPPGYGGDVARMMEMVKAMGGSNILEDDEDDDDEDRAEAMAAMAAMQASGDVASEASDATVSATEAELMAGLGGIPVKTGRVSQEELRQRLLAPPDKE